jgi:hypothetical protein
MAKNGGWPEIKLSKPLPLDGPLTRFTADKVVMVEFRLAGSAAVFTMPFHVLPPSAQEATFILGQSWIQRFDVILRSAYQIMSIALKHGVTEVLFTSLFRIASTDPVIKERINEKGDS